MNIAAFIRRVGTLLFAFLVFLPTFSFPPLDPVKYYEECKKFAVPFSPTPGLKDFLQIFAECGVDLKEALVITPESIINGACSGNHERIGYYLKLQESEKDLSQAFFNFLYASPTVLEDGEKMEDCLKRSETYRNFVNQAISPVLKFKKCRDIVVSFLAALEYKKNINPKFGVLLTRGDKIEEYNYENHICLGLELKNGLHYSKYVPKDRIYYTLPILPEWCSVLCEADTMRNDAYVCLHEIGHATHDLLGIGARGVPFTLVAENKWIRNTFFAHLDKMLQIKSVFIEQALSKVDPKNPLGYCLEQLNTLKKAYEKEDWPVDEEELKRIGITQIEEALKEEEIKKNPFANADFINLAVESFIKYMAFSDWTTSEELFQVEGIALVGKHLVIDTNSDLDLLVDQKKLIRWLHISGQKGTAIDRVVCCVPEEKFVESLFFLHGLDFKKYRAEAIQAAKEYSSAVPPTSGLD